MERKVNAILTKDLSRLGRNNAIVAHYTEIYFPENNVRFIAVNDSIDTFKDDNEIMPFKSVINEFYARDISKKTRSAFEIKAQNGEFTGACHPMAIKKTYKNPNAIYVCSNARRNGKEVCTLHYINYKDLYAIVLDDVQRNTRLAEGGEKEFLEYVTKLNKDRQKFQVLALFVYKINVHNQRT